MNRGRRTRVRLTSARALSPRVRSLTLQPIDHPIAYRAGQSIDLIVPTESGLAMRRPYSFASAPHEHGGGAFEIAVTRVDGGATSTALHRLPIGGTIHAEAPRTAWVSSAAANEAASMLLVATGSGLAPLRAVIQERIAADRPAPVRLLFGCRTEADVLWADELDDWERRLSTMEVSVTLSQPSASWRGRTGHVQRHLEEAVQQLRPELALVCGLSPMVDEVERRLIELGVPASGVRAERYDR